MSPSEIKSHFENATILYTHEDRSYATVPAKWLFDDFRMYWRREQFVIGAVHSKNFDCDDFAALYRVLCGIRHDQRYSRADEGIAVGEFHYETSKGRHAICVAFTDEGLLYVEPQTGLQIHPTEDEIFTQFFVRF